MQYEKVGDLEIFNAGSYKYLEIPYSTDQYSMEFLLPNERNIHLVEEEFLVENLLMWSNQAREKQEILEMPKFKLKQKMDNLKKWA